MAVKFRAVLTLLAAVAVVFVVPAGAVKPKKPLKWVDMSGVARQHPRNVFLYANSGGQIHKINWKKWGKNRTVGNGKWVDTSPPIPGSQAPKTGKARIVAWKPMKCQLTLGPTRGKKIRVYRRAKLRYPVANNRYRWANISDKTGKQACR